MDKNKLRQLLNHIGATQTVMQSYSELKGALLSVASLEEKTQTQRELMHSLETSPYFKSAGDQLERIYKTYEQVRFGSKNIKTEEVESFVNDMDGIYVNLQNEMNAER